MSRLQSPKAVPLASVAKNWRLRPRQAKKSPPKRPRELRSQRGWLDARWPGCWARCSSRGSPQLALPTSRAHFSRGNVSKGNWWANEFPKKPQWDDVERVWFETKRIFRWIIPLAVKSYLKLHKNLQGIWLCRIGTGRPQFHQGWKGTIGHIQFIPPGTTPRCFISSLCGTVSTKMFPWTCEWDNWGVIKPSKKHK